MTLNQTLTGVDTLSRTVLSTGQLSLAGGGTTGNSDWQELLQHEKVRMKRKETENKKMIERLQGNLKREQDRHLAELSVQAQLKREVSRVN